MTETKAPVELTSILNQVQALQADREKLIAELESTKSQMGKLQEGKREEMRKAFDTVISKWLADSVQNEETRKQFSEGMQRLVQETKENSGIWQVACEASAVHAKQLEELERLRTECSALRACGSGQFNDESSRKRAREPDAKKDDFWAGFEVTNA